MQRIHFCQYCQICYPRDTVRELIAAAHNLAYKAAPDIATNCFTQI